MGCAPSSSRSANVKKSQAQVNHNLGIIAPQEQRKLIEQELKKDIAQKNVPVVIKTSERSRSTKGKKKRIASASSSSSSSSESEAEEEKWEDMKLKTIEIKDSHATIQIPVARHQESVEHNTVTKTIHEECEEPTDFLLEERKSISGKSSSSSSSSEHDHESINKYNDVNADDNNNSTFVNINAVIASAIESQDENAMINEPLTETTPEFQSSIADQVYNDHETTNVDVENISHHIVEPIDTTEEPTCSEVETISSTNLPNQQIDPAHAEESFQVIDSAVEEESKDELTVRETDVEDQVEVAPKDDVVADMSEETEQIKPDESEKMQSEETEIINSEETGKIEPEEETEEIKPEETQLITSEETEQINSEETKEINSKEIEQIGSEETEQIESEETEQIESEETEEIESEETEQIESEE